MTQQDAGCSHLQQDGVGMRQGHQQQPQQLHCLQQQLEGQTQGAGQPVQPGRPAALVMGLRMPPVSWCRARMHKLLDCRAWQESAHMSGNVCTVIAWLSSSSWTGLLPPCARRSTCAPACWQDSSRPLCYQNVDPQPAPQHTCWAKDKEWYCMRGLLPRSPSTATNTLLPLRAMDQEG